MSVSTETKPMDGIWSTFRGSPTAVKVILLGVFLSRLGGFLNIFVVLYLMSEGYSSAQAAYALGVYGFGGVLGVLLGGTLAGRLGARASTVLGMAATAATTASLLYLPNYGLQLGAVALASLAAQLYRPASATLLSELSPPDRQVMIFAMYRFGLNLGAMAAPLLGFALYNVNGKNYTLLFWGEALICLVYAGLALLTIPGRTSRTGADHGQSEESASGSYLEVLRDRRYVGYLVAAFLNAVIYVQYISTLPLDVQTSGLNIFWYTVAVSLNGFVVIAFELGLTKMSQKWPTRLTVGLAYTLVGIGVACYGLPLGPIVIVGATLIWTLGEIIGGPAVFAYPGTAAPAHLRSRYIGGFQFMYALGAALGAVVGGTLFVRMGHGVWPVLGLVGVLAATLGVMSVRPPGTVTPAPQPLPEPAS